MVGTNHQSYNAKANNRKFKSKWYLDATLPKHVPFIGGSRFGVGSGARPGTRAPPVSKKLITKTIRDSVRKHEVDKWKVSALGNTDINGAIVYTLNVLGNIPIGTGESARLATDIFVKSVHLCMSLRTNPAIVGGGALLQSVQYRLMWIRHENDQGAGSDIFATARLGVGDIFVENTPIPFFGRVDHDRCTLLSDEYGRVDVGNAGTSIPNSKLINSYAPIGTGFPFQYQATSSGYSTKNKNLYCILIAYINGDNSGLVDLKAEYQWDVKYTDSR